MSGVEKRCGTCVFYDTQAGTSKCRRNPPSADANNNAQWPFVRPQEDWCGEYKAAKL